MKLMKRLLVRVNGVIRKRLFTQRSFIRLLFDLDVLASATGQLCNWGTIHQRLIVHRYIRHETKILEIGTGAHAIVAIFVKKHFPDVSILATDILPERIYLAKKTVGKNQVSVACTVADMFGGIAGKFDLILFYPPAIPSHELEELGCKLESYPGLGSRRGWSSDGGSDGLDVIRAFLDGVRGHLEAQGLAMVSVNPIQCDVARFKKLCQNAGLLIKRIHRLPVIMNTYVLYSQAVLGHESQPDCARPDNWYFRSPKAFLGPAENVNPFWRSYFFQEYFLRSGRGFPPSSCHIFLSCL